MTTRVDSTMLALEGDSAAGLAAAGDFELAEVAIDGVSWFAGFEIDLVEHHRRVSVGLGAVVDRRVLHAMWELPEGVSIPESNLSAADRSTLRDCDPGVVERSGGRVARLFHPAGSVKLAVAGSRRAADGLRRTAVIPPIFERLVVSAIKPSCRDAELATRRGIGLVWSSPDGPVVFVPPRAAHVGVPAVYRWWVGEIAYGRWLSTTAPIA